MQEVMVKTHLIITDVHEEYHMNWCGRLINTKPALNENGMPTFVIIGSTSRMEVNTVDMNLLERYAKRLTSPRGRSAVTSDTARIYIQEVGGHEALLGVMTHKRVKSFAPMYDKMGFR